MNQNIADIITVLRKERGLTQAELATSINYSDKVISKWERGESLPNIDALGILSEYFMVSTDQLLGKEPLTKRDELHSNFLKVTEIGKPSLMIRLSILVPLIGWIAASFYGPMYFVIFGLVFLVCWIIYGLTQLNGRFEASYQNHQIVVKVSLKSIELSIDDRLVDTTGFPLGVNYRLSGKIKDKTVKANISIFLFSSCKIIIE